MISLECYSNFLFGLPASSLIPLQIVLHNVDRIIFSKCTPKQQAMLQSSETLQHVMHSAKLFTSLLGFSLDSSTAYQAFTFWIQLCLWPQILSLTLFFYISPFPVFTCATFFSSRSSPSQIIFLCEHLFLHPCPYLINFNPSFMY